MAAINKTAINEAEIDRDRTRTLSTPNRDEEEEEEQEEREHLLSSTTVAICDNQIMPAIDEDIFDAISTLIEELRRIRPTVEQHCASLILLLDSVSRLMKSLLKDTKTYAKSCLEFATYLHNQAILNQLNKAAQNEDRSKVRSILNIINGKLSNCKRDLEEFQRHKEEATNTFTEALDAFEKGKKESSRFKAMSAVFSGALGLGGGLVGAGSAAVGITVGVGAIAANPLIAPIVCGVVGGIGIVAATSIAPGFLAGTWVSNKQVKVYEKLIHACSSLNRFRETADQRVDELKRALGNEENRLRLVRDTNPPNEEVEEERTIEQQPQRRRRALTMTEPIKEAIEEDLGKLKKDMKELIEKATVIANKNIPS